MDTVDTDTYTEGRQPRDTRGYDPRTMETRTGVGGWVVQSETERTQSYQLLAEASKCPPLELLGEHSPAYIFSKDFQALGQGEEHTAWFVTLSRKATGNACR